MRRDRVSAILFWVVSSGNDRSRQGGRYGIHRGAVCIKPHAATTYLGQGEDIRSYRKLSHSNPLSEYRAPVSR